MFERHDHVEGNRVDSDRFAKMNEPLAEVDRESVVPAVPIRLD